MDGMISSNMQRSASASTPGSVTRSSSVSQNISQRHWKAISKRWFSPE